jgi:hypothetical protein
MLKSWPEDGGHFVTLPLVYTEHPETGPQPRHVPHPTPLSRPPPACTGRSARAAASTTRSRAKGRGPAGDGVRRRPAGADRVGDRAAARERARAAAGVAAARGAPAPWPTTPSATPTAWSPAASTPGRARAPQRDPARGAVRRPLRLLLAAHDYPVLHVDALCRRRTPIWPATVVGKPRQEDLWIGDFLQELLSPLFPVVMPNVVDLWSYGETGYHALAGAVVQGAVRPGGDAGAFRVLGEGQLALTKFLWVLTDRIDLRDPSAVLEHLLARFRPETDLYVFSQPVDGHARLHGTRGEQGQQGRDARGRGPVARAAARGAGAAARRDPRGDRPCHRHGCGPTSPCNQTATGRSCWIRSRATTTSSTTPDCGSGSSSPRVGPPRRSPGCCPRSSGSTSRPRWRRSPRGSAGSVTSPCWSAPRGGVSGRGSGGGAPGDAAPRAAPASEGDPS